MFTCIRGDGFDLDGIEEESVSPVDAPTKFVLLPLADSISLVKSEFLTVTQSLTSIVTALSLAKGM